MPIFPGNLSAFLNKQHPVLTADDPMTICKWNLAIFPVGLLDNIHNEGPFESIHTLKEIVF